MYTQGTQLAPQVVVIYLTVYTYNSINKDKEYQFERKWGDRQGHGWKGYRSSCSKKGKGEYGSILIKVKIVNVIFF